MLPSPNRYLPQYVYPISRPQSVYHVKRSTITVEEHSWTTLEATPLIRIYSYGDLCSLVYKWILLNRLYHVGEAVTSLGSYNDSAVGSDVFTRQGTHCISKRASCWVMSYKQNFCSWPCVSGEAQAFVVTRYGWIKTNLKLFFPCILLYTHLYT
jgi:hypothetical protein